MKILFFVCVLLAVSAIMAGCSPVGSGPYNSESEVVSALTRYMDKECACGRARYEYFYHGKDTNISGCKSNGEKVERVLQRYSITSSDYKTIRSQELKNRIYSCLIMD